MGHQPSAIEKDFKWPYLNLDRLRKPRSKWLSQIFPLAVLMGLHCFCASSITFAETALGCIQERRRRRKLEGNPTEEVMNVCR
jgi:hypothetical protein